MSDFARADEAARVTRGAPTQRQDLAGTQAASLPMNANEAAVSVAISAGNTSVSVTLPPTPLNGDVATVLWKGNPSRMATVVGAAGEGGLTIRQQSVNVPTMWKFRFSGTKWQAIGP